MHTIPVLVRLAHALFAQTSLWQFFDKHEVPRLVAPGRPEAPKRSIRSSKMICAMYVAAMTRVRTAIHDVLSIVPEIPKSATTGSRSDALNAAAANRAIEPSGVTAFRHMMAF
jgi:hypothetical protein